ncbi:MAG: hypothetical protein ACI4JS_10910 [Oscillospiraceae bacterium]
MQIVIALVTLALCGGFLWWFKKSEDKKRTLRSSEEEDERKAAAQKTAQEFVNAKDLGNNCLYTLDGMIFAYIKIEGLCLELYSKQEKKQICRNLSSALSQVKRPYKYIAVSRPVDISKSLREYEELHSTAEGGRKKLLKQEMRELADMVMSGETLERQHYIVIWDTVQRADEHSMSVAANDLVKKFCENGISAELVDKKGIVRLCNLVNIPAYVHIESADIEDAISVLSDD